MSIRYILSTVASIIIMTVFMLVPVSASAATIFTNCGQGSTAGTPSACTDAQNGQNNTTDPAVTLIANIVQVLAIVIGIAAIFGIIISGLRMVIAAGDASKVATARMALVYSLVGVAVALLAGTIVRIVVGKFL